MTEVISVRFRNGCKEYYFDPKGLTVPTDTDVIVETAQGPEFARCSQGNHQVEDDAVVKPLRGLIRIATDNDRHTAAYNRGREKEAFEVCKKKIQQHKLEMKLVRVECSFDGSKILFFFTADGRVDFRELVKDLASVFRARIELRQIGVRDEAKMIGGLGICGRPFCCSQFMDEFLPVSIKMAKTQSLSLNPTKISGTCGRLMCCLKYEQDAYEDLIRSSPKLESFVDTPEGRGTVVESDLLRQRVKVRMEDSPETVNVFANADIAVLRSGKAIEEDYPYDEEHTWNWGSSDNPETSRHMDHYSDILRNYRISRIAFQISIGALILNRVISVLDVMRIYRSTSSNLATVEPRRWNVFPEFRPEGPGATFLISF